MTALATLSLLISQAVLAFAALPSHSLNNPPRPSPARNTAPPATPTTVNPRDGSQTSDDCVPNEWLALYDEDNHRPDRPLLAGTTRNYATISTQGGDGTHTPGRSAPSSAPLACHRVPVRGFDDEI
jgi:hypothetical protein